ncbi:hypothetical protein [Burkholderia phage CSP3]|nr:hypothetical protein [Burkholderia phage CSP3]
MYHLMYHRMVKNKRKRAEMVWKDHHVSKIEPGRYDEFD